MADAISQATGRSFAVQPGRDSWQGYGTDIFYDSGKWEGLEGGVKSVSCPGTAGGDRAANWAVLKHRDSGKVLVTGGIHLTYCAEGCDSTHECELGALYDELNAMRSKHQGAAAVWMGDLNRGTDSTIMQNLFQGKIGGDSVFAVDDMVQTSENTYYSGGSAIDHILAESGEFIRVTGYVTGQGVTGQELAGADHFPVVAEVKYTR